MSGMAPAVFPNAVTDPTCLSFPSPSSAMHLGLSSRMRAASPIVLPGPPSGLRAAAVGRTLSLTWTPSAAAEATSFVVEAGSAAGRSDRASADSGSPTPSLVATDVPPGTYFLRVRARNASGTSAASNEVAVSVAGACGVAPGAPTGLTSAVNGSSVTLSWQAPVGAPDCAPASYVIEAGSSPGSSSLASFSTGSSSTTFSASGVGAGTYYVRVRSANALGTSGPSNEATLTVGSVTCTGPPSAPTSLAALATGSSVSITWSAPSAGCVPTSYFLEAGSAAGLTDLAAFSTGSATPSFSTTGVADGTYYIRVKSENAVGRSAASNEAQLVVGGASGSWIAEGIRLTNATAGFTGVIADTSTLLLTDGRWRMFLFTGNQYRSAISPDGLTFTMEAGTRLPEGAGHIRVVRLDDGRLRAFHISSSGIDSSLSSDEGVTFTPEAGQRISASAVGASAVSGCVVVRLSNGRWRMYFSDLPVPGAGVVPLKIYSASSSDMLTWTADAGARIGPGAVLSGSGEHPAAWVNRDGSVTLFYFRNSTLGFYSATAADGLSFTTEAPVGLSQANDPDIVGLSDGSFRMYYNWGDNVGGAIYSARHAAGSLAN